VWLSSGSCCVGVCRTKVKVRIETASGQWAEKIPAWITWATQVRLRGWGLRQAGRQADGQTDRQTNCHKYREAQTARHSGCMHIQACKGRARRLKDKLTD
jgi:hypothetical protein